DYLHDRTRGSTLAVRDEGGPAPVGVVRWTVRLIAGIALAYGSLRAVHLLGFVSPQQWRLITAGAGATLLRGTGGLVIALGWTVPLGVAIGMNRRLARWCQPLVQIAASVPATALFPVVLLAVLRLAGGMNIAAILLMLMGTQWYLLFNVIAGASAIP